MKTEPMYLLKARYCSNVRDWSVYIIQNNTNKADLVIFNQMLAI